MFKWLINKALSSESDVFVVCINELFVDMLLCILFSVISAMSQTRLQVCIALGTSMLPDSIARISWLRTACGSHIISAVFVRFLSICQCVQCVGIT